MPESHLPQSWLAGEVLMDPFLLREARAAYADRGGGAGGYLAARRLLDQRLRAMVHWPRARDYADLADDLAAAGRDDDAILLRRVAATRALLTEAQTRWNTRYDRRAETARDRDVRRLIQGSLIDIDPDAPYPGVDGSLYWPGYTSLHAGDQLPVIMVSGRGLRELITGFDGHPAAERWLRSRGPTATGPLTPPDVPALPRAVLEEHILARMLQAPATIPAAMTTLPPATFTTDARYDIYAAITTLARRGGSWDTGDVAAELARRADWIPGWALSHPRRPRHPLDRPLPPPSRRHRPHQLRRPATARRRRRRPRHSPRPGPGRASGSPDRPSLPGAQCRVRVAAAARLSATIPRPS